MAFNLIAFFTGAKTTQPRDLSFSTLRGEAVVEEAILPHQPGRVRFQGSWWSAQGAQDWVLLPGQLVQVVGVDNINLIVEPIASPVLQVA